MTNYLKVTQLQNKNQFIIRTNEAVYFQSYNSLCAKVTNEEVIFGIDWDYSKTTLKHLYIFLNYCCYRIYSKIENSKNKKRELQKMIEAGIIKYDKNMK